ncbi:MAG: radical SAM protein [Thermotogota bacterium]
MKYIWINLTNDCNLKCIYCYQENRNDEFLTKKSADKIINDIEKIKEKISINFFGGEPLINFSILKYIVEKLKKTRKCLSYSITTNFTLINNNILNFLVKNNFNLTISLDGIRFEDGYKNISDVKIYFFKLLKNINYKRVSIAKVVSKENYKNLYEDTLSLLKFEYPLYHNFDQNIENWNKETDIEILKNNLKKLFYVYKDKKYNLVFYKLIEEEFKRMFISGNEKQKIVNCTDINNLVYSYNVYGRVSYCHLLQEIYPENAESINSNNIEELKNKINNNKLLKKLSSAEKFDYINNLIILKKCNKCKYNYFCQMKYIEIADNLCFFNRYKYRKNIYSKVENNLFCFKNYLFNLFHENH